MGRPVQRGSEYQISTGHAVCGPVETVLHPPARASQRVAAPAQALVEAGNRDVTIEELEGLNHLFQSATTGSPAEYVLIEETFSPAALDRITRWIHGHTVRRPIAELLLKAA